ncbi:MAG: helix-turn-helix domain-containing protein [Bacteroidota bacterium]
MKRGPKPKKIDADTQKELKQIGAHIRQLRKAKGYSSHELFAYDHGFARAQYLSYEHGRNMELYSLIKVAAALDMDLKDFFASLPGKSAQ